MIFFILLNYRWELLFFADYELFIQHCVKVVYKIPAIPDILQQENTGFLKSS